MKTFNHILVIASDDDQQSMTPVLDYSIDLARRHNAKVTVMDVVEPLFGAAKALANLAIPIDKIQKFTANERRKELADIASAQRAKGVDVDYFVAEGKPFVEIIRYVLQASCDLVIKNTQHSATQFFGGTDTALLRKCPCPLLLIKDDQYPKFERIMAAIDIDKSEQDGSINNDILDFATSFITHEDDELHVVQCWSVPSETSQRFGLGQMRAQDMERVEQLSELSYRNWIDELIAPYQSDFNNHMHIHLRKGDPKLGLPHIAQKEHVDLIVLGSIHRSGVAGMFIGTTAESVFSQVRTSVFAIKPEGFVTPVTLPEAEPKPEAA